MHTYYLILDSLVCQKIPSTLICFPYSGPSPSFPSVQSSSGLISAGLKLPDKLSVLGLGRNYQRIQVVCYFFYREKKVTFIIIINTHIIVFSAESYIILNFYIHYLQVLTRKIH